VGTVDVITLTLSNGTATPITITDSGASGYVLVSVSPGGAVRDNTYATSRWLDGAALTSTRDEMTSVDAVIQTWGTSLADSITKVATLGSALGQYTYTVTAAYAGGSAVYTACPASYSVTYDPNYMRNFLTVVTASIPRQP
jgi:hypothetical protein